MWAWLGLSLALLALRAEAREIESCKLSAWSAWGPCVSDEQTPAAHAPFSFPLPVTSVPDRGRAMMAQAMKDKIAHAKEMTKCQQDNSCPEYNPPTSSSETFACANGMAGGYPCRNIDLLAHISIEDLGYTKAIQQAIGDNDVRGNDIWGWTDPDTNKEYAIVGLSGGSSFVDVTDPQQPKVLAFLRSRTGPSIWRDMKVISNTAYIVAEAWNHGLQVFDLLRLRDMTPSSEVPEVTSDADYSLFGNAHNIVSNEETGYVYVVGATQNQYPLGCRGGLHFINVRDRLNPAYAGCFPDDGYTHDAQCVIYTGPDVDHQGKEICFCYNEDSFTIVDVTNKEHPKMVSKRGYLHSMYTHQGWVTEDQTLVLLDDELDETYGVGPDSSKTGHTITYLWDVTDLDNPELKSHYISTEVAIDHNQYIIGDLTYQSNYGAGLRILHIDQEEYALKEVAYFDCLPTAKPWAEFEGTWSNYPYFKSGNVVVSSIEYGLFIVRPNMSAIKEAVAAPAPYKQQERTRTIEFAKPHANCGSLVQPRACAAAPIEQPVPVQVDSPAQP